MEIYELSLVLLTLFIGVVLSIHLAMNARVGDILQNAQMGNAIFWSIGGITAIIIGITNWDSSVFGIVTQGVPLWLLTAGAMGAALVFGIAWIIPKIGAGVTFVLMIAGQVVTGMVLSHFGILGSPVEPISVVQMVGVALLIGGAAIVTLKK